MRALSVILIPLLFAACSGEQAPKATQAWISDAPPGAAVRAAFLQIDNPGRQALTLQGVDSDDFGRIEMHTVAMQGGMMRMRAVDTLRIDPGSRLALAPGGAHLMLKEPVRDLRPGDQTTLNLTLVDDQSQALTLRVAAPVQNPHEDTDQHEH